jgi:NADH:ubiquinone oxidoreductase subunit K
LTSHDFLFYAFSAVAIAAALACALRADLARAATAALVGGAAMTVLLGLAAAPVPATLVGACVLAGYTTWQRSDALPQPAVDDASTLASRLRSAALVAAFFAIAARSILIVRWSFVETAPHPVSFAGLPPVSLTHYLIVALVLFAIGLFAAISRRTVAGVGLGLAHVAVATVLALASVSRFVGDSGEAAGLAALAAVAAMAAGAATIRVAAAAGDLLRSSDAAWRVAGSLSTVLAGLTLALLATAW